MNYTKYLVALIILNFTIAVVANIDYFKDITPKTDLKEVESKTSDAEGGALSIFDMATYIIDAVILALKLTVLAPYYTGKTLELLGLHPLICWMITGINYLVYVMWMIDIKRGKTFF